MPNHARSDLAEAADELLVHLRAARADVRDELVVAFASELRGTAVEHGALVARGTGFVVPRRPATRFADALTLVDQYLPGHDVGVEVAPDGRCLGRMRPHAGRWGDREVAAESDAPASVVCALFAATATVPDGPGRRRAPEVMPADDWIRLQGRPTWTDDLDRMGARLEHALVTSAVGHPGPDREVLAWERALSSARHADPVPGLATAATPQTPVTTEVEAAFAMARRILPGHRIGVTRRGPLAPDRVTCMARHPTADRATWVARLAADGPLALTATVVRAVRRVLALRAPGIAA